MTLVQYFDDHVFFQASSVMANFSDGCSIRYDSNHDVIEYQKLPSNDDVLVFSRRIHLNPSSHYKNKHSKHKKQNSNNDDQIIMELNNEYCQPRNRYEIRFVFIPQENDWRSSSNIKLFEWKLSNVWMSYHLAPDDIDDNDEIDNNITTSIVDYDNNITTTSKSKSKHSKHSKSSSWRNKLDGTDSRYSPKFIYWNIENTIDSKIFSDNSDTFFSCQTIEFNTFHSLQRVEEPTANSTSMLTYEESTKVEPPSVVLTDAIFGVHLNGRSQETGKTHKLFSHHDQKSKCHINDGILVSKKFYAPPTTSWGNSGSDSSSVTHHSRSSSLVILAVLIVIGTIISYLIIYRRGSSSRNMMYDQTSSFSNYRDDDDNDDDEEQYMENELAMGQFKDNNDDDNDNDNDDNDDDFEDEH